MEALRRLKGHQCIIAAEGFYHVADRKGPQVIIVMQLEMMTLWQHCKNVLQIPLLQACIWLGNVLEALAFCHDRDIIHRDVTPSNILLGMPVSDTQLLAKLGDFGNCAIVVQKGACKEDDCVPLKLATTYSYAAPENFKDQYYFQSDVWSVGVIAVELYQENATILAVNIPEEARGRTDPNPWFEAHAVLIAQIEVWTSSDDTHSDFLLSMLSASPRDRKPAACMALHRFLEGTLAPAGEGAEAAAPDASKHDEEAPLSLLPVSGQAAMIKAEKSGEQTLTSLVQCEGHPEDQVCAEPWAQDECLKLVTACAPMLGSLLPGDVAGPGTLGLQMQGLMVDRLGDVKGKETEDAIWLIMRPVPHH